MTFTDDLWAATGVLRERIDALPFLAELRDGTLPRDVFVGYLAQDTFYLTDYSRALAATAAQAPTTGEAAFWSSAAHNALVAEQELLHSALVPDLTAHSPSPTTVGYSSYLVATAATAGYPVAAAALLPCFWLYADVGTRLLEQTGDLTGHPYREWIGTYADPTFTEEAAHARRVVDAIAAAAGPDVRQRMATAFETASRFEWMFWDAAYRQETWPV